MLDVLGDEVLELMEEDELELEEIVLEVGVIDVVVEVVGVTSFMMMLLLDRAKPFVSGLL